MVGGLHAEKGGENGNNIPSFFNVKENLKIFPFSM